MSKFVNSYAEKTRPIFRGMVYIEHDVFGILWMMIFLLQLCIPLFSVKWILTVAW